MEPSDSSRQLFKLGDDCLTFQNTPWDSNALNKRAISIASFDSNAQNYTLLLKAFLSQCKREDIQFCSVRIPASNNELKQSFQSLGFQIVEHTLDVTASPFRADKAKELLHRIPVTTTDQVHEYIDEVKAIAEHAFHFGRFHEDPNISIEQASLRNRNWINDLIAQGASFNILLKKERVLGFMAWSTDDQNHTNLLFGGVVNNFQHLSYSFWANTLLKLSTKASVSTTISSSNTPVLNLYSYFGFHFTNPQFGLHLHT